QDRESWHIRLFLPRRRFCLSQAMVPVWLCQRRVGNPLIKVEPDKCVLTAVKGATRHGAMGINGAAPGVTRAVVTVAIRALCNQIGLAQIPVHDALMNVLFGEGKGQAA